MKAIILKADGTAPFLKDLPDSIEAIQSEVGDDHGTLIERVRSYEYDDTVSVWVNEEGAMYGFPLNRNMLAIKSLALVQSLLAGDAVVLGAPRQDGWNDVPGEIIDLLVTPTEMPEFSAS